MSDATKPLDIDAIEHAIEQGACCHCGTTIEDHTLLAAEHTATPMYQPWEETTLALVAEVRRLRSDAKVSFDEVVALVTEIRRLRSEAENARNGAFDETVEAFRLEWEKAAAETTDEGTAKLSVSLKYRYMIGVVNKARSAK